MKKRKIIVSIILMLISIMLCTTKVQAVMQSRPDGKSCTNKTAYYFFTEIRNMESSCLGKEMNLDTITYKDTSGNGVDVHMAKNTEWGTVALLAASAYGNAPSGQSNASTTGNATGVYQMADATYEYVAGIYYDTNKAYINKIKAADTRYYNLYKGMNAKSGDALVCIRWLGAISSGVINGSSPAFERGYKALFGYGGVDGDSHSDGGSRACLCVGAEL